MRKYSHAMIIGCLITVLCLSLVGSQASAAPLSAGPVGTAFTYQGQLKDGSGNPVTNTCDFQFSLYDALTSGNQIGSMQQVLGVTVTNGYFTSSLDFGPGRFGGDARWLEIAVRCPAGGGGYTTLSPRQPLTPAPYSLYALNAGLLNNLPSTSFQRHYQNLLVVAKSGGDFTTISDALASITVNDQDHRFLIYVAPGTYAEEVTMKSWVDIEGAGELATKITYTGFSYDNFGTLYGASNAELSFLTVENTGAGNSWAIAIYNGSASPRLTHITAIASGGTTAQVGVSNMASSPTMTDVTATASGGSNNYGVYNAYSSSPTMTNVTVAASGGSNNCGVYNDSSSPTMTNVSAKASGGASSTNYGVYNAYSSSPTMTDMIVTASGGSHSYGVYNASSSPTMTSVTATSSGGSNNYGVGNYSSSSPTMTDTIVTALGGSSNYGMWNDASSASIQRSTITGTNDGLHNVSGSTTFHTVIVNNSVLSGGSSTIYQDSSYTTEVGASQFAGTGGAFGGTLTCVSSYNASFQPLSGSCT